MIERTIQQNEFHNQLQVLASLGKTFNELEESLWFEVQQSQNNQHLALITLNSYTNGCIWMDTCIQQIKEATTKEQFIKRCQSYLQQAAKMLDSAAQTMVISNFPTEDEKKERRGRKRSAEEANQIREKYLKTGKWPDDLTVDEQTYYKKSIQKQKIKNESNDAIEVIRDYFEQNPFPGQSKTIDQYTDAILRSKYDVILKDGFLTVDFSTLKKLEEEIQKLPFSVCFSIQAHGLVRKPNFLGRRLIRSNITRKDYNHKEILEQAIKNFETLNGIDRWVLQIKSD